MTEFKTCSNPDCNNEITDGKQSGLCFSCRSKQGKRNKRKGSAQELRYAKLLQSYLDKYELPYKVRRTPRSGAIHDFEPADLMISGPEGSILQHIHFESKNTEHWYIEDWFTKAQEIERDKGTGRQPALIVRKPNKTQEFAIIDSEFFAQIIVDNALMRRILDDEQA